MRRIVCTTKTTVPSSTSAPNEPPIPTITGTIGRLFAGVVEGRAMSVSAAVAMFVYLWLLGPICEEIIYRGLLWGAVERLE